MKKRISHSERVQVITVHLMALTCIASIIMLIAAFTSSAQANVHRAVASIAKQ